MKNTNVTIYITDDNEGFYGNDPFTKMTNPVSSDEWLEGARPRHAVVL